MNISKYIDQRDGKFAIYMKKDREEKREDKRSEQFTPILANSDSINFLI